MRSTVTQPLAGVTWRFAVASVSAGDVFGLDGVTARLDEGSVSAGDLFGAVDVVVLGTGLRVASGPGVPHPASPAEIAAIATSAAKRLPIQDILSHPKIECLGRNSAAITVPFSHGQ